MARGGMPCAAHDAEAGDVGGAEVGEDFAEEFRQEDGPWRRRRSMEMTMLSTRSLLLAAAGAGIIGSEISIDRSINLIYLSARDRCRDRSSCE